MSESEEWKNRGVGTDPQHQHQYGTFQGVPSYPQPAIGFPQSIPPPGSVPSAPPYYHHTYQAFPVAEGRPVREPRLPCCGLGLGWFLFIIGFFLAAVPWYVGALILLCSRVDYREKPGFIACTVAAVLALVAIVLGLTQGPHAW